MTAWRIVRQPNGLLAVFSEVVDDFTVMDLTVPEAVEVCREHLGEWDALVKVRRGLADAPLRGPAVPGDGLSRWRECIDVVQRAHGALVARERRRQGCRWVRAGGGREES